MGGARPYDPADQGTLPPWFANSPQAAAVSTLINDFVFRCGTFLATDNVVATPGAKPVHAYLFAQAPIYSSDDSTACAPFPADPGIQNACHSFELPYVFNTLSATNATLIPPANARLARRIARHWTNFARTLDPGPGWRPLPRHLGTRRQQHRDPEHRQRRHRRPAGARGPHRRLQLHRLMGRPAAVHRQLPRSGGFGGAVAPGDGAPILENAKARLRELSETFPTA